LFYGFVLFSANLATGVAPNNNWERVCIFTIQLCPGSQRQAQERLPDPKTYTISVENLPTPTMCRPIYQKLEMENILPSDGGKTYQESYKKLLYDTKMPV
jgi:hypothetical protein